MVKYEQIKFKGDYVNNVKGGIRVIIIDIIGVLIGVLNGFLLPKVLDVEGYAIIKTFGLYIGYAGMLHLGFSDGMYILLGGKNYEKLDFKKVMGYFKVMLKLVFIIELIILVANLFIIKDPIVYLFLLYAVPFQISLFFSLILRATGNYNGYSLLKTATNIFTLVSVMTVILLFKDPYFYIWGQIIIQFLLVFVSFYLFKGNLGKSEAINFSEIKYIITIGFSVLLANVVTNLIISFDRWFVKINFSTNEFAYYTFGTTLLALFLTLIASVGTVLYPFLSNYNNKKNTLIVKNIVLIIAFLSLGSSFAIDFIVQNFLPDYAQSMGVLKILILAFPFISTINVLYANLFKVFRKTKKFTIISIAMLAISFVSDLMLIRIFNRFDYVAFGTLITYFCWYMVCSLDKDFGLFSYKDMFVYGLSLVTLFGLQYLQLASLVQFFIYLTIVSIICWIAYKEQIIGIREKIAKN